MTNTKITVTSLKKFLNSSITRIFSLFQGNDGLEDLFSKEDGDDRLYSCEYCDYVTHMADLFGVHTEKEHNDSSKLAYVKCDKCGGFGCAVSRFRKKLLGLPWNLP